MSYCWNESDHRRQAERDRDRGRKDLEEYDRHTSDGCKEAYTREWDRLERESQRQEEERRERAEQERRDEERRIEARRQAEHEEWLWEERYRGELEEEQEQRDSEQPTTTPEASESNGGSPMSNADELDAAVAQAVQDIAVARGETEPGGTPMGAVIISYKTLETLIAAARAHRSAEADARDAAKWRAIDVPELHDFDRAVPLESAHQRKRWGNDHDAGKEPPDWFWLLGYLAGKALAAHIAGDTGKALHHTVSSAAALRNWHANILGLTNMRPGIDGDAALSTPKESPNV